MEDVTPVIRTDIVLTSTLNVVAAATTEDDNILKAKFHLECDNSAVDIDDIQQKVNNDNSLAWFIVFRNCDDFLNATLQEEGSTKMEWMLKKYEVDNDNTADTELEWIWKKYRVDNDNIDNTE